MSLTGLRERPRNASGARPNYYTVASTSDRESANEADHESAIEAIWSALIAQKNSTAAAGYKIVREIMSRDRSIDYLSAEDAAMMLSVGEVRLREYTADDFDLLVDDD